MTVFTSGFDTVRMKAMSTLQLSVRMFMLVFQADRTYLLLAISIHQDGSWSFWFSIDDPHVTSLHELDVPYVLIHSAGHVVSIKGLHLEAEDINF